MAFYKTNWFKYLKNFVIGIGAAAVMMGALGKINSEPWGGMMITVGLVTEAVIFALLGILPPEKDYYWEKLYPGLQDYHSRIAPLTEGDVADGPKALDGEIVENRLGGMLSELQSMSKSLGSLKALQEVDFSQTGEQVKAMGNFYERIGEAMQNLDATIEDTKLVKDNIGELNTNLRSLNGVYGNVLNAFGNKG